MEDGDGDRDREKRNGHREGRNSGREGAKDHNMELLNNEDLDNEDNEVHQDNNEGWVSSQHLQCLLTFTWQWIDYEETFSLVPRYKSIQYLLTHAALLNWEIEAMDAKLTYLHGVLEEEIYVEQLEGFIAQGQEDKVCKLVWSLYGLKQAGQVSFANTIKRKLGFDMIHSDVGAYVLCQQQGGITKIILILYVDDLFGQRPV